MSGKIFKMLVLLQAVSFESMKASQRAKTRLTSSLKILNVRIRLVC